MTGLTYYKNMEPFFGEWRIVRLIGEGSYGKVFEIEREDFGRKYTAALKIITLPQSESELRSAMADGLDSGSVETYYRSIVTEIVDEFALMAELKGVSNIVSYEDHKVIQRSDRFGWDVLIRMELLTPLFDHIVRQGMTRRDIAQLGIDICKALELCKKQNIIHRDIKPENIFVSKNGDYKLGDFGIAKTVEKTNGALSQKGTPFYMAPEVLRGEAYGSSVDIFSLGLVLFRLLNNNRAPFLPLYPAPLLATDREAALQKRLSGAELPCPVNADEQMLAIIRKASAFRASDRYESPAEMRADLERVLAQQDPTAVVCTGDVFRASYSQLPDASGEASRADAHTEPPQEPTGGKTFDAPTINRRKVDEQQRENQGGESKPRKKTRILPIALAAAAVIALVVLGIVFFGGEDGIKLPGSDGQSQIEEPATFASMLWGSYIINDYKADQNGYYNLDFTQFMESMKYEDIEGYNLSCVPYHIQAEPCADDHLSEEDWQELRQEFLAEHDGAYWENYRRYLETNLIKMYFCDKVGGNVWGTGLYKVDGNRLLVCFDYEVNERTYEITEGEWIEYTFSFQGRNLVIERNGCRSEMVPDDFTIANNANQLGQSVHGYVADDSQAYQSIASISCSIYPEGNSYFYVNFTDGGRAIDPVITFNDDDTVTISWQGVNRLYNGRYVDFDEPGSVTVQYIYCGYWGIILIDDGQYYCYQSSSDQYEDSKQAG